MIRVWRLTAAVCCAGAISAQQPVNLAPRFEPGQTLRYAFDFRVETRGTSTGDIEDSAAARGREIQLQGVVRLEVLRVLPASSGGGLASARLRATYESLAMAVRADVPDPQLAETEAQMKRIEGRSFEYTLAGDGAISDLAGLEDFSAEQRTALTQALAQISLGKNLPPREVAPGATWRTEPVSPSGAPLLGYAWQTVSTYLRNEPCKAAATEANASPPTELCAVILTKGELLQLTPMKDPTPEEYARNELRTSGKMSGAMERLLYVSLATGRVVSVTQNGAESSDIAITNRQGELRMRYAGSLASKSQITLLGMKK
jgi:hypothetical protein